MKKERLLSRRDFLTLGGFAAVSLGLPRWARAAAEAATVGSDKTVVIILQRGAMDGLNVVVPFADATYRRARPTLALRAPGAEGGVLDLDGNFGLHPSLAPLLPLYKDGNVAFVQAAGSPDGTRSHFDAQDYLESGTPGVKLTEDGWLNRALAARRLARDPLAAVAIAPRLPLILRGECPVTAISGVDQLKTGRMEGDLESLYDSAVDELLSGAARDLGEARRRLDGLSRAKPNAHVEAGYPKARLGRDLFELARVLKAGLGTRVGFVEVGGWDHHQNEAQRLQKSLGDLGGAIAAFHRDLGSRAQDVLVLTMTEFGRTIEENGDGGTDHGHASVMMLVGGRIKGGRVHGRWPGLDPKARFESRDLEVTTDYRRVAGELLTKHLGVGDLSAVFPGGSWPALGLI